MTQSYLPETKFLRLGDERILSYCEYGDPAGKPCFYFHGTPGSRFEPVLGDQAGKEYGYRMIAFDRPGIGQSDGLSKRKLLDWPADVSLAAELLEMDRFGVMGVSGGGPYGLSCAYSIPDQLEFTVLMGSWGPVGQEPALWSEMAPLDRFFGRLSNSAPWTFYLPFSMIGYAAKWMTPQGFVKSLRSSMSDPDRQLMSDESMAQFFAHDIQEAFRQGVRGPADDAIILYGEWGFDLEEINVEVNLYHGRQDLFAPFGFARYLDEKLPHSRLHAYGEEGHLFVMRLFETVFLELAES